LSETAPVESQQTRQRHVRLLLYALEVVGDPGEAESLLAEAAGRAFRWSPEPEGTGRHRAMLKALTAVSHGPLNRCPRHPLPPELLPDVDEFDHDIEVALAELPGRERAALFLILIEGYNYEECAAVLGTTPDNAGMLVYRARAALRSRLVGAPVQNPDSSSSTMPSTNQRISKILRSDCRQAGAFISAEIDNQLSEKQRVVLAVHMEGCGICGEERSRLEQASAAVLSHWGALSEQLLAGRWDRRARKATARVSSASMEAARVRRLRAGLFGACALIVVAGALLWLGLLRSPEQAVVAAEGKHSRRGDVFEARERTRLEFFDGSKVDLEPGAVLRARRIQGLTRPKLQLFSGRARFQVRPGRLDLVVETAAGQVKASSGSFQASIIARDSRGRMLKMRFITSNSVAPGERLGLAIDCESNRLVLAGNSGPDMSVPRGVLAAVPAGEQPRVIAMPGRWIALPRSGDDPESRSGAGLCRDAGEDLLVLFGGRLRGGSRKDLSDLWVVDPVLGGCSKLTYGSRERRAKPSPWPPAQQPGALLPAPGGKSLWLYPGRSKQPDSAVMWLLDPSSISWREINPAPVASKKAPANALPLGRRGAALAVSRAAGGFLLVGGELGGKRMKDTWLFKFSNKTWQRLATKGRHPEARSGAVLCGVGDGGKLYLFGGRSSKGKALHDTWCLDLTRKPAAVWRLLKPARKPEGRWGATMAAGPEGKQLMLFGGRPRWGGPRRDTWLLSPGPGSVAKWTQIVNSRTPPADEFGAPALVWYPRYRAFFLWCRDRLWSLRPKS
jgi:DNA-directed RNA polymerase specialized sigma24 family protein